MISLSNTFTDAIDKLPKNIKARVMNTVSKYDKDSSLKGLNLEKIKAKDQDIYSIRVNDDYRIICKMCERNGLLFLYVGKHDDAYDWASSHAITIDSAGVLSVTKPAPDVAPIKGNKRLSRLAALNDSEMAELDILPSFWAQLREKVFFEKQLVGFKQYLSEETYVVLADILKGHDKGDALDFYRAIKNEMISPNLEADPLFKIPYDDLSKIGIPVDKLDLVSSINSIEQLQSIEQTLPSNAVEALYKFIDNVPLPEIVHSCTKGNTPTNDINIALNNPGTKQHVVNLEGEEEIERLFRMPMEKWRVFLHPEQRRVVEATYNGPSLVIGGAGTGKTVVVVHRAKELAKRCSKDDRILVTTFSRTLADDIDSRLKLICNADELSKIDVKTLDSVTNEYLGKLSNLHIRYDKPDGKYFKGNNTPLKKAWRMACDAANYYDFDYDFYMAEWRDVFEGQWVRTLDEYLTTPRKGRGNKRLNKAAREKVFRVAIEYQNYMKKNKWIDIDWAQNHCAEQIPNSPNIPLYKHVLVDECQDFTSSALRFLRALAGPEHPNDLFLAGDSRQSIYNGHSSFSSCGIVINNRSSQLKLNYRTTREIYDLSLKIQKDYNYPSIDGRAIDRDESVPTKHGELPVIKGFSNQSAERKAVIDDVQKRISEGYKPCDICIVAKTNDLAKAYAESLRAQGIDSLYLANNQSDDKEIPGVRTATMYRVKGMEFECMYIISANADLLPYRREYENPDNEKTELITILKKEANLLSVAVTRARKTVWLSYYGAPTKLIENCL